MIILSNCLTDAADEGCRKVVSGLVRRIKAAAPETCVVSCGEQSALSDRHLPMNKLMVSPAFGALLRERKEPLLYLPKPARMRSTAIRLLVLSRYAGWGLRVLLPMEFPVDALSAKLLKISGAEILTLSASARRRYAAVPGIRVRQIKAGVDTKKFVPVDAGRKAQLREAYHLPQDKPIVLHVGHLKSGRGIGCLAGISEEFHVVLVVSTQTADEREEDLRKMLEKRPNLTIFDTYLPHIEEIYQLSDVYLFPVESPGHCIDLPLSALEAAACGIPVAATAYGELQELLGQEGFYEAGDLTPVSLNPLLKQICEERKNPRESVLKYDWDPAVSELLGMIHGEQEEMK